MSGVVSGSQIDNSGVVGGYPKGHVVSSEIFIVTDISSNPNYAHASTTETVLRDSTAFQTISGNTYVISCEIWYYVAATSGSPTGLRGFIKLYKGTDKTDGDTSSFGDLLDDIMVGRYVTGTDANTTWAAGFGNTTLWGAFVATATEQNYFTITVDSQGNDVTLYTGTTPACIYKVTGYQGNVSSAG